ncbi:anti-sigma factor [Massilia sp. R2A-15]|uniref:anti-sigma factor family protein n=1 Tax=Massilia sp. R2A-15 TaxID=3064278 RepID=UPI0027342567|nr:anti-sigma factor [Massilia sp. R2A-15]WLI91145.1 anti-sigma factor [Massilia sp. R2A-15]
MECKHSQEWMSAYLDEELEASTRVQVEIHLAGCAQCAQTLAQLQALRTRLAGHAMRYAAPAHMQERIHTAIRAQRQDRPVHTVKPWRWNWLAAGAAGVAATALVLIAAWNLPIRQRGDLLAQEVAASHIRSLMPNHLADIVSTDQHTVKPWFAGKLDFSPPVIDLAQQGYPLIGGRLDFLDQRPVASIVYQYRKHILNLYVWPAAAPDMAPQASSRQGFQLLRWRQGGMQFFAVSDLNPQQMGAFSLALRTRLDASPGQQATAQTR